MAQLRNVSKFGDLDIPIARREVPAGETFEVPADVARVLLAQSDNFAPADAEAEQIAAELAEPVPDVMPDPASPGSSLPTDDESDPATPADPPGEPAQSPAADLSKGASK